MCGLGVVGRGMRPRGRRGGCRQGVSSGRFGRIVWLSIGEVSVVHADRGARGYLEKSGFRFVVISLMPSPHKSNRGLADVVRRLRVRPWCRGPGNAASWSAWRPSAVCE